MLKYLLSFFDCRRPEILLVDPEAIQIDELKKELEAKDPGHYIVVNTVRHPAGDPVSVSMAKI